jgi:hypothetical protein
MTVIVSVIFVLATLCALIGYGSGATKEGAALVAATGAFFAGNSLVRLLTLGVAVLSGLWLISVAFF